MRHEVARERAMRFVNDGIRDFFKVVVCRIAEQESLQNRRKNQHEFQARVFDERDEFFLAEKEQLLQIELHPSTFFRVRR